MTCMHVAFPWAILGRPCSRTATTALHTVRGVAAAQAPRTDAPILLQVDKMASILVKVTMDMWLQGEPRETLQLMLPMLTAAMRQPERTCRVRVFDLLYSLSLHAQMIEPVTVSGQGDAAGAAGGADEASTPERPSAAAQPLQRLQPEILRNGVSGHALQEVRCRTVAHARVWSGTLTRPRCCAVSVR